MRSSFIVFVLGCLLFTFMPYSAHAQEKAAAAASPKIVIVDVDAILGKSKAAQSLQKQLKEKRESFQKEFAGKEAQLKESEKTLMAEREKLSQEEFAKKRQEYEQKIMETRKLYQKRRNSLDQGVAKAMGTLRKSIAEAAAEVSDEKGYDIVLTREGVMIAEKSLDITEDVLKKLDAKVTNIPLTVE